MNVITTRPILTEFEQTGVRNFLHVSLPESASEETLAREWARHFWYNHFHNFKDGDPVEALTEVPVHKLYDIAHAFELDYRDIRDRRP